jgi:hypothetical protein
MNQLRATTAAQRGAQMFPTLEREEIGRLERFGGRLSIAQDELLAAAGREGHSLLLVLSGRVEITHPKHADPKNGTLLLTGAARLQANWRNRPAVRPSLVEPTMILPALRPAGH